MQVGATIVSSLLIAVCVLALWWHYAQWGRQQANGQLSVEDRRFYHRQYQRRMQATAMLGLCGVAMLIGTHLISPRQFPTLALLWWLGTMVLVVWAALLGVADLVDVRRFGRRHLDRIEDQQRVLQAQLRALNNGGNEQKDE